MNVFIKNLLSNKKILISLLFIFSVFKTYASLFDNYSKKTPEEVIQSLAIEQIDNPEDPYINYNLGVALYQTHKYDAAKNSFERAVNNAKNPKLKERCFFNLANSCYKNVLSKLPAGWDDPEAQIDQKELESAINDMQSAIKNYEIILEKDKDNKQAKTNLSKAKELLEKLLKKQQNQKQDQNKDNKNNKDEKNKNEKQNQQNSQDSKNQDSQSKEKSDQQKQDQSQQQKSQDQQQQDQQQNSQENKQQEQENQAKQDKSGEQEQKQEAGQQLQEAQAQNASVQKAKQETAEEKSMRMMLENLQSDEDNLQKVIIQRQTKGQKPLESGQKPW